MRQVRAAEPKVAVCPLRDQRSGSMGPFPRGVLPSCKVEQDQLATIRSFSR